MVTVTVKFFASLREYLDCAETRLVLDEVPTVATIWERAAGGQPLPNHTLAAVNMEYARFDRAVANGDEVAFFPPVTGGAW
ncbi:sulfur-carrier protein [Gammaproteobacteria bacterium]